MNDETRRPAVLRPVLVKRPSRITTDGRGRSVWTDPVENPDLELVSTVMLKQVLESEDAAAQEAIKNVVDTDSDGVLARDVGTGYFEIIDDNELQKILDENQGLPKVTRPMDVTLEPLVESPDEEGLSLVSTQALRKILGSEQQGAKNKEQVDDAAAGGFNPYDSN